MEAPAAEVEEAGDTAAVAVKEEVKVEEDEVVTKAVVKLQKKFSERRVRFYGAELALDQHYCPTTSVVVVLTVFS